MRWAFVEAGIAARAYRAPVDSAGVRLERVSARRADEVRQHAGRGAGGQLQRGDPQRRGAGWRALLPEPIPAVERPIRALGRSPISRRACSRPSSPAIRWRPSSPPSAPRPSTFRCRLVTPDPARPGLRALELFHGPTGAFKDFGARFLMACFDRLGDPRRAADRARRDLGRYRRRGRLRGRGAGGGARRDPLSEGPGLAVPGAAADLLGRAGAGAGGGRAISTIASGS